MCLSEINEWYLKLVGKVVVGEHDQYLYRKGGGRWLLKPQVPVPILGRRLRKKASINVLI